MTLLRVQRSVGAEHECGVGAAHESDVVIPAQAGIHFDLVYAAVVPLSAFVRRVAPLLAMTRS
jgi:hypothetical protein